MMPIEVFSSSSEGYAALRMVQRSITTGMLDEWTKLPMAVFSQQGGDKFLYVTNAGAWVLDKAGILVTVYSNTAHWDGAHWISVNTPATNYSAYLSAVSAVSSADVWAVVERDVASPILFTQSHEPTFEEGYEEFLARLGYAPDLQFERWWSKRK